MLVRFIVSYHVVWQKLNWLEIFITLSLAHWPSSNPTPGRQGGEAHNNNISTLQREIKHCVVQNNKWNKRQLLEISHSQNFSSFLQMQAELTLHTCMLGDSKSNHSLGGKIKSDNSVSIQYMVRFCVYPDRAAFHRHHHETDYFSVGKGGRLRSSSTH